MGWAELVYALLPLVTQILADLMAKKARERATARRDAVARDGSGEFVRAFGKPDASKASAGEPDRDAQR